jgi:hypothetical protein
MLAGKKLRREVEGETLNEPRHEVFSLPLIKVIVRTQ